MISCSHIEIRFPRSRKAHLSFWTHINHSFPALKSIPPHFPAIRSITRSLVLVSTFQSLALYTITHAFVRLQGEHFAIEVDKVLGTIKNEQKNEILEDLLATRGHATDWIACLIRVSRGIETNKIHRTEWRDLKDLLAKKGQAAGYITCLLWVS